MARRLPPPPITIEDLQLWAENVNDILVNLPAMSSFSTSDPNGYTNESSVTADRGTLGINVSSIGSVLWIKESGSTNVGWVAIF